MTSESTPSRVADDVQTIKAEMKILHETIEKIQQRLDQIEDELTALRNLF